MRARTWERPCEYMWATCEPHGTENLLDPHLRRSRLQNCLLRKFSGLWYSLCSLNWDRLQNALSEPSKKLYLKQGPHPSLGPRGSASARAEGSAGTGLPWGSFLAGQPLGQGLIGGPGGHLIFACQGGKLLLTLCHIIQAVWPSKMPPGWECHRITEERRL